MLRLTECMGVEEGLGEPFSSIVFCLSLANIMKTCSHDYPCTAQRLILIESGRNRPSN